MKTKSLFAITFLLLLLLGTNIWAATYYVDYTAGNDSNSGTLKSTPWKRHPYMNGWSGNYTHYTGDHFIFKGGVTWTSSCFEWRVNTGGSVGNPDVYGVDLTWFNGQSWTRPVFDGEGKATVTLFSVYGVNASYVTVDKLEFKGLLINSNNNFGKATIGLYRAHDVTVQNCHVHGWDLPKTAITGIYRNGGYAYVTTAAPHGYSAGQLISVAEVSDISFNGAGDVEASGKNAVVDATGLDATHFRYANSGANTAVISNSGWTSLVYRNGAMGGIIGNYSGTEPPTNVVVQDCEIENVGGPMSGTAIRQVYTVRRNKVHDCASFVLFAAEIYDNEVYNLDYPTPCFDPHSHTNTAYITLPWGVTYTYLFYNNYVHDSQAGEGVYPEPGFGVPSGSPPISVYVYNNIIDTRGTCITASAEGAPAGHIQKVFVYNNTLRSTIGNYACVRVSPQNKYAPIDTLVVQNNHIIKDNVSSWLMGATPQYVTNLIENHNFVQTLSAASNQGYTTSNRFAPSKPDSPTVDTGISLLSVFSTDILGVTRPKGAGWDIGAYEYVPSEGVNQSINLLAGWNWISFNVLPTDHSLNLVFNGILDKIEQVKGQTQSAIRSTGNWKGDLADMSGIGQHKMYKVKVSQACTLTVTGAAIASTTPIALVGGWNWVAFLPTTAMPIATALDSIKGQVLELKSLTQSATYNGTTWSGTLTQLEPGKGYAIRVSGAINLIYPEG